MKKVFAVLCCILLLFSVVSCGDSKEKLVAAPSEDYVIECLEKVPGILEIEAVTEDTDPMKNLNKPGWYTAHVYFSYELVNQDDVYGDDLIDKGTVCEPESRTPPSNADKYSFLSFASDFVL